MYKRGFMVKFKSKAKHIFNRTVSHLKEDISGYKENIKKGFGGKKEQKHEIKEDVKLITEIKKVKKAKHGKKKKRCSA